MKKISIIISALLIIACNTEKDMMQSWLGHSKHDLIATFGEPARDEPDGRTGEILIYAKQETNHYQYRIFYITQEGNVYSWLLKADPLPPDRINISSFKRY